MGIWEILRGSDLEDPGLAGVQGRSTGEMLGCYVCKFKVLFCLFVCRNLRM